jgi:hypothetical protein
VADAVVPGGIATGLVSETDATLGGGGGGGGGDASGVSGETRGADAKGRVLVSSATLQVCVPDAPFPPPFPTSKPYRAYLANMVRADIPY